MTVTRQDTRSRIVQTAARLLREQGPAAVTTRGVAQAAGLQAPAIYRLFDDKDALLDAVAEHVFAAYVAGKTETADAATGDPVADLHAAWDTHIGFGLANPGLFALLADPARGGTSAAAAAGAQVLHLRVSRIAAAGRLRVPVARAVDLIRAAGTGAVLTLLGTPPDARDPGLADMLFEAVMRTIVADAPAPAAGDGTAEAVNAFRTVVPKLTALTGAERALLTQWLDR